MYIKIDLVLVSLLPNRLNLIVEYGTNVAAGKFAVVPGGSVTSVELEEIHGFYVNKSMHVQVVVIY